jgi:putative PIG3 family NAD(P)H quinone oxidoreductase
MSSPGGAEVLRWDEVPDPVVGPGDVLIRVSGAGVNRADLLQREGHYPVPEGAPEILGLECAGTVEAVGEDVTRFTVGQSVAALLDGGGYAELAVAAEGQVLDLPDHVDLQLAGGLPESACTVWSNVFMLARLTEGEDLLVHGGASGIGTMALALAAARRCRVVVTAGTVEKRQHALDAGAAAAIDYHDEDWPAQVREATGGKGADVILDVVGGSYLGSNLEALAVEGRLVVIGMQGNTTGELDLGVLMRKRAAVLATGLRSRPAAQKARIVAAVAENVLPLLADGRVGPVVDRVVSMADAGDAHRALEAGEVLGKIVLTPPPRP